MRCAMIVAALLFLGSCGQADPMARDPVTPRPAAPADGKEGPWIDLTDGGNHRCALDRDRRAWCWGQGSLGQLGTTADPGHGSPTPTSFFQDLPHPVLHEVPFITISAGSRHTCALDGDGDAWCWGDGVRTTPPTDPLPVPTRISGGPGFVELSAGADLTCARTARGEVRCWDGFGPGTPPDPVALPGPANRVFVGAGIACASTPAGLACWGRTPLAPLDGVEVLLPGDDVLDLWSTSSALCALDSVNGVHCMGRVDAVREGIPGADEGFASVPDPPSRNIRALGSGGGGPCVVTDDGEVFCAGTSPGEQGTDAGASFLRPIHLPLEPVLRFMTDGDGQGCSLGLAGHVECWGMPYWGLPGLGVSDRRMSPELPVATELRFRAITVGGQFACGVAAPDGALHCWGGQDGGDSRAFVRTLTPEPVRMGESGAIVSAASSLDAVCAIDERGGLYCMGMNYQGALGVGSPVDATYSLTRVELPEPARSVAMSHGHTCAVGDAGGLYCWGNGARLETDMPSVHAPVPVDAGRRYRSVGVGSHHSCAATEDGEVYCWGEGFFGELGLGEEFTETTEPRRLEIPSPVREVHVGQVASFAVDEDGYLWSWGMGLMNGLPSRSDRPAVVNATSPMRLDLRPVEIATAREHTCALLEDGGIVCWGSGSYGQLGHGTPAARELPTPVSWDRRATAVAAGDDNTCALDEEGRAFCWGRRDLHVIGDGEEVRIDPPRRIRPGGP